MDVTEVLLPGVGLRYEFTNYEGDRVGIIAGRTGYFELVVYAGGDPDEARPVVRLNSEEADTVAEILGAPRIAERFADLTKEVPGLAGATYISSSGDLLPLLPAALALAAVTTATKLFTGRYAASRDQVGRRGQLRAGTALIARGEFSIVMPTTAGARRRATR